MRFFDQTLDVIQTRQQGAQNAVAAIDALRARAHDAIAASEVLQNYVSANSGSVAATALASNAWEAANAFNRAVNAWGAAQLNVIGMMTSNADVSDIAQGQAVADSLSGPALNAAAAYANAANGVAGMPVVLASPVAAAASNIAANAVQSTVAATMVSNAVAGMPIGASPAQLSQSVIQSVVDSTVSAANNANTSATDATVVNDFSGALNALGSLKGGGMSGRVLVVGLAALLVLSMLRR